MAICTAIALSYGVRAYGKRAEADLWTKWGGTPTTVALRHRSDANPHLRAKARDQIQAVTGMGLPSREMEQTDPDRADRMIEGAVRSFLQRIRTQPQAKTLHREVSYYGFQRNLFGVRHLGRLIATLGAAVAGFGVAYAFLSGTEVEAWIASLVVNVGLSWFWWLRVSEAEVRTAATTYTQRLLEVGASLSQVPSAAP